MGVKLRGGNPNMTDAELLARYREADQDETLASVRGDLRAPDGEIVPGGENVTAAEAYELLLKWKPAKARSASTTGEEK